MFLILNGSNCIVISRVIGCNFHPVIPKWKVEGADWGQKRVGGTKQS